MPSSRSTGQPRRSWMAILPLFTATAIVVLWQNSRVGVLWDLTAVLDHAYRWSLGDVPYRDFPFPIAPLTFLTQAVLIKLWGRAFFHTAIYCAVVGGLATVLTWRILVETMRGTVPSAPVIATLLSAPLVVLGIYAVYPHPFYDADCTFTILLSIAAIQRAERSGFAALPAILAGATSVIPVVVKQNTGLAFLGSTGLAFMVLAALGARRNQRVLHYGWMLAGMIGALVLALTLIHFSVGLHNYTRWTLGFAISRRPPQLGRILAVYWSVPLWWIAAFGAGMLLWWPARRGRTMPGLLSTVLMSLPFLSTLYPPFTRGAAPGLLLLWPLLLLVSMSLVVSNPQRGSAVRAVLPYILIATINGAFLSQQLGSTYALWPLLALLLGTIITSLAGPHGDHSTRQILPFAAAASASILLAGASYVWSSGRLSYYVRVSEGDVMRSSLPALAGLSVRGPWLPQFDELVRYTEREIPRDDGLIIIPGEDPYYYATGRRPRFPVLQLDLTFNPYRPAELAELVRARGIRWMIVKRDLQLSRGNVLWHQNDGLIEMLRGDFSRVARLSNYDIYRRSGPP